MPTYTVHEPPAAWTPERRGPERFVFVRDGFHFWAFLVPPLWMLWHRLWLVLLGYIVLSVALTVGQTLLGVSATGSTLTGLLISLFVGLEAGTLRRWTYRRRKWREVGVVTAAKLEDAERRFFDAWTEEEMPVRPRPLAASPLAGFGPPAPNTYVSPQHVVGLFPEPGGPR